MDLTAHIAQQLSRASRTTISAAMGQLPITSESSPRWLETGHRYGEPDISRVLRQDTQAETIDGWALAQRIAASLPSHVLDGWSLLGRAVHCLIKGDTRAAVHLGYYAELRAAVAIVASEGIAIFDRQHFIVTPEGTAHRLRTDDGDPTESGTHRALWPVYDWWVQQPAAVALITRVIEPSGKAIYEWFNEPSRDELSVASATRQWLNEWGLDLKRMSQDRDARNASSYGPSALHGWQTIDHAESVRRVVELWTMFDPTGHSKFEQIDRLVLRNIFLRTFRNQTTRQLGSNKWNIEIGRFVDRFLDGHAENHYVQMDRANWRRFLIEPEGDGSASLLTYASRSSNSNAADFPIEMLSRAALLLRLASGSCGIHLINANAHWESLTFWLHAIGARRGFWELSWYPDDPIELWEDIREILDDIKNGLPGAEYEGSILEECERIGMWGFGV